MNFLATLAISAMIFLSDGETTIPAVPYHDPPKHSAYAITTLFKCVEAEEGGNSYDCKYMAASCIVNRAERWGMTLDQVIYQPFQFAVVRNGSIDNVVPTIETKLACLRALREPDDRVMFFSMGNRHFRYAKLIRIIDGEYFYE